MRVADEVLKAAKNIVKSKGVNEFRISEVVDYMIKNDTKYKIPTIRGTITSRCCVNAPQNHLFKFEYFERIRPTIYKVLKLK